MAKKTTRKLTKKPTKAGNADRKASRARISHAKTSHIVTPSWTKAEIEEAFRRFQAAEPAPKGELHHVNPYTLLVAVVLLAQATDAGVNKATPAYRRARTKPVSPC